eukprot:CAMPEP_0172205788 /NCGR_PEP_ID=MMETSP1050-20130122/32823_1 /TAXON_ID=233186 /ORGANISM="Cryptomonas curvata, Strain CCAP979/52" /LENGTH=497 /DNA_ID=CAMNT_0012884731 /DNA_START=71 /DNA_END=1563 /DNA_ORIENTATION=-
MSRRLNRMYDLNLLRSAEGPQVWSEEEVDQNAANCFDSKLLLSLDDRRIAKIIAENHNFQLSRDKVRSDPGLPRNETQKSGHHNDHNDHAYSAIGPPKTREASQPQHTDSRQMLSMKISTHADADGQNGASVRDSAELQAMATQSSSVAFLQRTVKSLRTENERMRHELAALEARETCEADRRRADDTSKRDARASTLEAEMETSSQAHRAELERLTRLLVQQVEENQARAVELATLNAELALLRDFQAHLVPPYLSSSYGQNAACGRTGGADQSDGGYRHDQTRVEWADQTAELEKNPCPVSGGMEELQMLRSAVSTLRAELAKERAERARLELLVQQCLGSDLDGRNGESGTRTIPSVCVGGNRDLLEMLVKQETQREMAALPTHSASPTFGATATEPRWTARRRMGGLILTSRSAAAWGAHMRRYFHGDFSVLRMDQLRASMVAWDQGLNCVCNDFGRLRVPNQGRWKPEVSTLEMEAEVHQADTFRLQLAVYG